MLISSVRRGDAGMRLYGAMLGGLVLGSGLTGTLLWSVSGLFGGVPTAVRVVVLLSVGGAALLRDARLFDIRLPQLNRQIASDIFDRGQGRGMFLFGLQLGTGVATYLSAGAPYVLAAAVLVAPIPYAGIMTAAVGFAMGRFVTALSQAANASGAGSWAIGWAGRSRWLVPLLSIVELLGWLPQVIA